MDINNIINKINNSNLETILNEYFFGNIYYDIDFISLIPYNLNINLKKRNKIINEKKYNSFKKIKTKNNNVIKKKKKLKLVNKKKKNKKYECVNCYKIFDNGHALGGHLKYCNKKYII